MSFREYSNTILTASDKKCPYPTIRSWDDFEFWGSLTSDSRETIDAHGIVGTARLVFQRTTTARGVSFNGVVRNGRCIYVPDRTNTAGTPPNYTDSIYTSHLFEIDIETGDTTEIVLGSGTAGNYQVGQGMQLAVIGDHKVLVYDYWLDQIGGSPREDTIIRIVDFATEEVVETLTIDTIDGTYYTYPERITTIKDTAGDVHLFALCTFLDTSIGYDGEGYNYLPNRTGTVIFHKNYTQGTAWERYDTPFDTQENYPYYWCNRYHEVIANRYLVLNCYRIGAYTEPEGEGIQPCYIVEVVYDILNPSTPPVMYEIQTPGDGSWDAAWFPTSAPDHTNNKLYANIKDGTGGNRTISFDPVTGAFAYGSFSTAGNEYAMIYHFSSSLHAYFNDTDGQNNNGGGNDNFYKADDATLLGHYDIPLSNADHTTTDFGSVCNLLDENAGGNPLVWYYDNIAFKLRAIDIITGSLIYDAVPTGFTNLYETNLVHLGNCLLLVTKDAYPSQHIDFYVVT